MKMIDMTLREYFAIHAPEPSQADINFERTKDQNSDPYNEKGKQRSMDEIKVCLRYTFADLMIKGKNY